MLGVSIEFRHVATIQLKIFQLNRLFSERRDRRDKLILTGFSGNVNVKLSQNFEWKRFEFSVFKKHPNLYYYIVQEKY